MPIEIDSQIVRQTFRAKLEENLLKLNKSVGAANETGLQHEGAMTSKSDTVRVQTGAITTALNKNTEPIRQALSEWDNLFPSTNLKMDEARAGSVVVIRADNNPDELYLLVPTDGLGGHLIKVPSSEIEILSVSTTSKLGSQFVGAREGSIIVTGDDDYQENLRIISVFN